MKKVNIKKPVVPYAMGSPYNGYDNSARRGYISGVNNISDRGYPYRGGYYGQYTPLNKESRRDACRTFDMYGRRTIRYNEFLKRWETQLSDVRMVTVERDEKTNRVEKYVHTPYIMSEQYFTEFEYSFLKWRALGLASIIIAVIVIAGIILSQLNVI